METIGRRLERRHKKGTKLLFLNRDLYIKRLGSVILLIIYAYFLGKFNFLISTAFFLFAAFYLYDRRDYLKMIIISAFGSACLYMLFVYFLKLQL